MSSYIREECKRQGCAGKAPAGLRQENQGAPQQILQCARSVQKERFPFQNQYHDRDAGFALVTSLLSKPHTLQHVLDGHGAGRFH